MKGNPYHDPKTGRFTNAAGDIESYEALTDQNKQIQRRQDEADRMNGVESFESKLYKNYYEGAENSYTVVKNLLKENPEKANFNHENINETLERTIELYKTATGEKTPACYNTAGALSAVFESKGIDHSVILGVGTESSEKLADYGINHAWVRRGTKVYDTFGNNTLQERDKAPKYYKEVREFLFKRS